MCSILYKANDLYFIHCIQEKKQILKSNVWLQNILYKIECGLTTMDRKSTISVIFTGIHKTQTLQEDNVNMNY